ncbi:hypothetical protein T492DRAFT_876341 [Pavlovales sp. CCMP2436]|nr:hypothetical protein T492DRAFT_876341 [Pavlovales sp. CCMP2436]
MDSDSVSHESPVLSLQPPQWLPLPAAQVALLHPGDTASPDEHGVVCQKWNAPTECPACPRKFATKYQQKKHFMRRHFVGPKEHPCEICKVKFFTVKEDWSMHVKSCGKVFTCSCGIRLQTQATLKRHFKHSGHVPASLEGQQCDLLDELISLGYSASDPAPSDLLSGNTGNTDSASCSQLENSQERSSSYETRNASMVHSAQPLGTTGGTICTPPWADSMSNQPVYMQQQVYTQAPGQIYTRQLGQVYTLGQGYTQQLSQGYMQQLGQGYGHAQFALGPAPPYVMPLGTASHLQPFKVPASPFELLLPRVGGEDNLSLEDLYSLFDSE